MTERGPGRPKVIVVGGIHGDETGGVRAVRRLRDAELDLQRGVAFVLANPDAIDAGTRYITSDLNRVFPGDPAGNHEEQLAAELCSFIEDRTTLALHGTRSEPTPFALIHRDRPAEFDLADGLPVPHVVDYAGSEYGSITRCGLTIEIEVGAQGTEEAAVAAEQQARAFLRRVDALSGDPPTANQDFFRMHDPVPKPPGRDYAIHVENFERVEAGAVYATVDGRELIADRPFHPILFSTDGYQDIFGYTGTKVADAVDPGASGG